MGVPINTLITFFVWQILIILDPVSGLPFSSISSLKTLEPLAIDESSEASNFISNADTTEGLISSPVPGTSSKSCQLLIGSPDVNANFYSSQTPSLIIKVNNEPISTADVSNIKFFTTFNLQSNIVSPNIDPVSSCSLIDENLDELSTSGLSITPILNVDFNSDGYKRELRDTISVLEPRLTNGNPNLATSLRPGFSPNCVTNSPCASFPITSSPKSAFPCLTMPQGSDEEVFDIPSDVVTSDCSFSNSVPYQCSSGITNVGPSASLQSNFVSNPAFRLLPNRCNLPENTASSDCTDRCDVINNDTPSEPVFDALSTFADVKNYIDSRKSSQFNSNNMQNQPCMETNRICPCQINQINNNVMYAKALQNNIALEQPANNLLICNNNMQVCQTNDGSNENNRNNDLTAEQQNILRIRNNVIPRMQLDNRFVQTVAQTDLNNNDCRLGCPLLQSVSIEDNQPVVPNNNIVLNPSNDCVFTNNNLGNTVSTISFNNAARLLKNNFDNYNANAGSSQIINNQGCPTLTSIPIYNRDSLQNKQSIRFSNCDSVSNQNNVDVTQPLQNNNMMFNNDMACNQNNQGCPELLAVAQNKLYTQKSCDANMNVVTQDTKFGPVNLQPENNCNNIPIIIPNDNLVQAMKRINEAKINQPVKSSAINILPFGKTVIDGKSVPSNFFALVSIPGPVQSTCTDSSNSKNFLTIQDVSKCIPYIPVNPFSNCAPSDVPVNIPANIILTAPYSVIDNVNPFVTNVVPPVINFPISAPTVGAITSTEAPVVSQFFTNNQDLLCKSNIQPMFTVLDSNINNSPASPFVSSNFIPIQSLPQVSFVNNIPSSTITIAPTIQSNLPCNSFQPLLSSSCMNPLTTPTLPQSNSVSGVSSSLFPCLNNIVTALTQNIISTLKTKIPSTGTPLALPPVNPFSLKESSLNSQFCFDTNPPTYAVSTPNLSRVSLPDIPVACNEYLPPLTFIPLTSFNSDLFCFDSDECSDSCSPFALSKTDAYYPELSFVVPSSSSDCSCLGGPLFMPASYLPQSSSVIKINNTGREAKGYEQLVKSIVL